MEADPRTYVIADARDLDGTPYEVTAAAFDNLDKILTIAVDALDTVELLARNASMQRDHDSGNPMDASAWYESVLHRRLTGCGGDLDQMRTSLEVLKRAASFDPKGRLDVKQ